MSKNPNKLNRRHFNAAVGGPRQAGADRARQLGSAPHPSQNRVRRFLRAGFRHRTGPALAYGL